MHSSYNAPFSSYPTPSYDLPLTSLNNTPPRQWSQESSDSVSIRKPFTSNYIAARYPQPYKAYNPQNQALVTSITNYIDKGKGVRSYLLGENYTEKAMLHGIRNLTTLFDSNLNALHHQMAAILPNGTLATPNTQHFISKIEEHIHKGTRWTSHLKGENFPEKQILRCLTNFNQMADAHFKSLHYSMSQLQSQVDYLSGHSQTLIHPPPENDALLSEALLTRQKGTGNRSRLHSMFVPHGENYTELKGVKMMNLTGEFLLNNMDYYHQWMDRLQKQLGINEPVHSFKAAKPRNQDYYGNLQAISNDAQFNPMNLMDANRVDRRLLAMMQPLTHIVADNAEYLQNRMGDAIAPQVTRLMKR